MYFKTFNYKNIETIIITVNIIFYIIIIISLDNVRL